MNTRTLVTSLIAASGTLLIYVVGQMWLLSNENAQKQQQAKEELQLLTQLLDERGKYTCQWDYSPISAVLERAGDDRKGIAEGSGLLIRTEHGKTMEQQVIALKGALNQTEAELILDASFVCLPDLIEQAVQSEAFTK